MDLFKWRVVDLGRPFFWVPGSTLSVSSSNGRKKGQTLAEYYHYHWWNRVRQQIRPAIIFPRHFWSGFVYKLVGKEIDGKYEHHCVEWTSRRTKHEAKKIKALSYGQRRISAFNATTFHHHLHLHPVTPGAKRLDLQLHPVWVISFQIDMS